MTVRQLCGVQVRLAEEAPDIEDPCRVDAVGKRILYLR